jgi:hypothetical protein
MKKIGILTFHRAENFGAVMQAFALQTIIERIKKSETDVEIIDYIQVNIEKEYRLIKIQTESAGILLKSIIKSIIYFPTNLLRKLHYHEFRNKYLKLSHKPYRNKQDINSKDIFITGSDQIWNSEIIGNDDIYYLSFAGNKSKKIAYAASFGKEKITPEEYYNFEQNVQEFSSVSIREQSTTNIIYERLGKKYTVTLDPSMLLTSEEWVTVFQLKKNFPLKRSKKAQILIYRLGVSPLLIEISKKISLYNESAVTFVGASFKGKALTCRLNLSMKPIKLMQKIYNADYVITDSFHGTAYSIIFNKDFFVIPDPHRSARIDNLLELCNLKDRKIENINQVILDETLHINYRDVNRIIENIRKESIKFLIEALEE